MPNVMVAQFHVNVFIVSASGGQKPQFLANFDIWGLPVKVSVLGVLYPNRSTDGVIEICHGGVCVKFHPYRCNVSPLRDEKPQNRPLSNLNRPATGALRFAQCCR